MCVFQLELPCSPVDSPAPSNFSLPLHASHPQAQPLPQRVLETVAPQAQARNTMASLDIDMAVYTQGLANFDIPLDMACPTSCPRMPCCRLTYPSICSPMHFKSISNSIRRTCPSLRRSQFQWTIELAAAVEHLYRVCSTTPLNLPRRLACG